MTYDRPPAYGPATPDYVLAVIRDSHRQQCQFDPEAEPDVELTFQTTIAEWRSSCDLLEWRQLGRALDSQWKLGRPDTAWHAVLEPAKVRTLRELCEFIARGSVRPSVEPVSIMGSTCLTAGAFLAIRALLRDTGADVDSVAPSTPLDQNTRRHFAVFLGPISRLAPNALPEIEISTPWYDDLSIAGYLLGLIIAFVGCFISPFVAAAGLILTMVSWATVEIGTRLLLPSSVTFGNLQTFRDLAKVVAEGVRQSKKFD
jgi:hypothetical protein